MRDNDHLILENIYIGKILLSEKIYGNLGWVYHRTTVNPEEALISKEGIKPSANTTAMYGKGLYCCYDINEQLKESMRKYGRFILKGKVDLSGFIILDKDVFELARPQQNFESYLKSLDVDLEKYKAILPYTSKIAYDLWRYNKRKGANGIIFTGETDGKVAVIWTRQNFIPYQYASDIEETRTTEGWSGTRIIQRPEDLNWINLNPNISHIKRAFDPDYDEDRERGLTPTKYEELKKYGKKTGDLFLSSMESERGGNFILPDMKKVSGRISLSYWGSVIMVNLLKAGSVYIDDARFIDMRNLKQTDGNIIIDKAKTFNFESLEECGGFSAESVKLANLKNLKKVKEWIFLENAKEVNLSSLVECKFIKFGPNLRKLIIRKEFRNSFFGIEKDQHLQIIEPT